MAYGTPRAILSDGAIRCIDCAIVKFAYIDRDDIDTEVRNNFIVSVDRVTPNYAYILRDDLSVVREGQNQDFLVDAFCEDCYKDLEATCTDY